MNQFNLKPINFGPMPTDAYLRFAKYAMRTNQEHLVDLNMGEYYDMFDTFYDSREAAQRFILPYFSKMHGTVYPQLKYLSRVIKQHNTDLMENIYQMALALNAGLERLNPLFESAHKWRAENDQFGQILEAPYIPLTQYDYPKVINASFGGWNRSKLMQVDSAAETIAHHVRKQLTNWCAKNNAALRIREPMASRSQYSDGLLATNTPIHNIHAALSSAQETISKRIGYERDLDPLILRSELNFWFNHTSTMMIQFHATGLETPLPMSWRLQPVIWPSILTHDTQTSIATKWETASPMLAMDEVAVIRDVSYDIVEALGSTYADSKLVYETHPDFPTVAAAMQLYATAISIMSSNTKVGSGNHKSMWIHSPLSAWLCDHFIFVAPQVITRLDQLLGD